MPLPHAWILPDGQVRIVKIGHWDLVPQGKNFEDMYALGWIRIGGFGGYTAGEYTQRQGENFVQGRASDITLHKDTIGYMLQPDERIRIAFSGDGVILVTSEQFWDSDILALEDRASLFAGRTEPHIPLRRPKRPVRSHNRRRI